MWIIVDYTCNEEIYPFLVMNEDRVKARYGIQYFEKNVSHK